MDSLHNIYYLTLETLKRHSSLNEVEFEEKTDEWRNYPNKFKNDEDFFNLLVQVTFYSGFKSGTVNRSLYKNKEYLGNYQKVKEYTFEDAEMVLDLFGKSSAIANAPKVCLTILNAREFHRIIMEYGSFKNYLQSYNFEQGVWNEKLYKNLQGRFYYLGEVTAYHFLMDIGAFCIKPDRQIVQLFMNLGLIRKREKRKHQIALKLGRDIALETGEKIRVVDIVLVTMRQGTDLGLEYSVCPNHCGECLLNKLCRGKKESS